MVEDQKEEDGMVEKSTREWREGMKSSIVL